MLGGFGSESPALQECKKLLEQKGGKSGENPFNPAYLTAEERAHFCFACLHEDRRARCP